MSFGMTDTYTLNRLLPKEQSKKVIELIKDELSKKITQKIVGLRRKTYNCLIDIGSEDTNTKGTKKCDIKRKHKLQDYKICLEATQLENEIIHLENNEIDANCLKKYQKEFMKNNELILITRQ